MIEVIKGDKLEEKYYTLKFIGFNKEQNQNEKNAYRAKMGKLSAEEFSIKNDENINDEEKQKRLAEINEEKKLLENTKNNDISENLNGSKSNTTLPSSFFDFVFLISIIFPSYFNMALKGALPLSSFRLPYTYN